MSKSERNAWESFDHRDCFVVDLNIEKIFKATLLDSSKSG
jgi:hypothetical protein